MAEDVTGNDAVNDDKMGCENCKMRAYAEKKPNSIWAKLWRWHTTWCPGWKAYQEELARRQSG